MRQFGLLGATLLSMAGCLLVGELSAQQPLPSTQLYRGQSGSNFNTQGAGQPTVQATRSEVPRPSRPVLEPAYIAVIGAVKTPRVFESAEPAVPLKTLIEQAGGETAESLGTVRIMERTHTRFITTLQNHLDMAITHGQVVFVVPRGGRTAQVTDPRQPPPVRMVLIGGLARSPLLFNIGNQSRTFGDLLLLLGQPTDLVDRQQVKATLPQGQWMTHDSLLVHNTVIDFNPEAVNADGVRAAVDRGFGYELPVRLDRTASVMPQANGPATNAPTGRAADPPMPAVQPPSARDRIAVPAAPELRTERPASGIERTGSSIPFDEPMPFPARSHGEVKEDANQQSMEPFPIIKSDGRAPLMLPRTWQNPEDEESQEAEEGPEQQIDRTSAGHTSGAGDIQTVSAEAEVLNPPPPAPRSAPLPPRAVEAEAATAGSASSFPWPQSWLALCVSLGVAATSIIVSRIVSRGMATTVEIPEELSVPVVPEPVTAPASASGSEDDQRFLQRLIVNQVPLVEEEASLPPADRLHGLSIGGRRLIVHEAHEGLAGPHFKVRAPNNTREVELRLRQLIRSDRAPSARVTTAQVTGSRTSRVSPLERALRHVDREET